jgi:hypothetical protein
VKISKSPGRFLLTVSPHFFVLASLALNYECEIKIYECVNQCIISRHSTNYCSRNVIAHSHRFIVKKARRFKIKRKEFPLIK